jgi:hypothetical protein
MPKSWRLPMFLSGLVLMSQAFPLPSPVRDAATGAWASGFTLHLPKLYILFAPFCGVAVRLSLLSYHQTFVFLFYLVTGLLFGLGWRRGGLGLLFFLLFLVWVILIPHPMARLVAQDPDVLLIDFHSHTNVSHDGRPSFTFESNMRWHANQGYGASFITDHNRVEASQNAKALSRANWRETGYRSLEGEEASLYKTHLILLGVHEGVDNRPYDSDPKKIPLCIHDMQRKSIVVIAALPEHWFYHGENSPVGTLNDFIRWGIDGFEIVNSVPKALDFPPASRRNIVELCRQHNLPMTGVTDNHGWGYATAAWNAMRLPGWQSMDPDKLEAEVLSTLKTRGFNAVQVLERARYNPENVAGLLLSPFVDALLYWRSLQSLEAVSWVVWIWITTFLYSFACRKKNHGNKNRI